MCRREDRNLATDDIDPDRMRWMLRQAGELAPDLFLEIVDEVRAEIEKLAGAKEG